MSFVDELYAPCLLPVKTVFDSKSHQIHLMIFFDEISHHFFSDFFYDFAINF